jgi:phosphatidylserine decarboxylase
VTRERRKPVSDDVERAIEARYQNSFGRRAGYLPRDRAAVDRWLADLKKQIGTPLKKGKKKPKHCPSVAAFEELIERDGVTRMYVTQMIDEVPAANKQIGNVAELLAALDLIVRTAPVYNRNPADQNNFFPMSNLFTYMMMTPAGEAAFRDAAITDALRAILLEWCQFLDGPESRSVLNDGPHGWLSQPAYEQYHLYEFEIPDR